ncbi:EmrB/QacA subfamily drug resistance transporter [Diaminobutyricimonas aerilata]|uniref:EmrB/QacA subfamily drug resistance transporter n=1 Tax=Diaminobutyricimonas aerilata TaxID=1162967 RepID=A0A2M9CJB0_9MICO|nr:MFS transporter [Diaminobutyricimonas aerilata]PJJ71987.1 EmrB/QacA subfamily drug resistance transporter [Diaminobutyricimonas aerilata]
MSETPSTATGTTRQQRLVLAIAILASFASFLDGTLVNVALPAIADDLGGGLTVQQWVVDAYLITLGSLILVAGSVSDVLGRLTVLRIGLVGFGVTSVMIAAAPTPEFLAVSRALQGVAGALLVPSSLALITSNFRDAAQAKAIGAWTAWTSAAILGGPVVGGLFIDYLSWRWAFLINVLPVALTLLLMARLTQRDERRAGVSIDYAGAVLATLGLAGTVFALIEQGNLGWAHPAIWLPFTLGVLLFAGFLVRQRRAAEPLMPLNLFTVRNFGWGNLATFFIYAALSLSGFVITVFLQQTAGYGATAAGLVMIPSTIIMIVLSSYFGKLSGRYGPRIFMTFGPLLAAAGFALMLGAGERVDYWTQLLPGVLAFGLGLTATVAPLTSAILGAIETERSGIASAVNNAVARVAGLIAIAFLGVIVGERLDVEGFQRGLWTAIALMVIGGVVSWLGIRTPRAPDDAVPSGEQARAAEGQ